METATEVDRAGTLDRTFSPWVFTLLPVGLLVGRSHGEAVDTLLWI